ncbi:MAG: VWA domain-containing protein [Lachnospiraceae bacterium]|nr:VWA domain-containing protein [Lachnospiraceae bacterium]
MDDYGYYMIPNSASATVEYEAVADSGAMYSVQMSKTRGANEIDIIPWNTEEYSYNPENAWLSAKTSPFSTFAADVDTASYANVRRMLTQHTDVPADAVRLEEMINYFRYDYAQPKAGEPFSVTTEMAPCPWNENSRLLMIGLNAKELDTSNVPNSNLVFLIDVSGSMEGEDRLGLVQRSFKLLCEELRPGDRVSIVTYACGDKVVLEGATGDEKTKIVDAIEDLFAGGGTNGSAGIQSAYRLAEQYFIEGGNNRVILATDGDLNIGITDEGGLTRLIEEEAKSGVFLSVLGFGWGNISDTRMEALADHGNGNYSYIDSIAEARKVLIEEMGGTLFTVAKDVKLQVEFNPALVKGYRLIGYENRLMAAEDFVDDTKDGGEIGAGHQVTALYEVALKDSKQEIPEVESRYGNDVQGTSELTNEYLTVNVRYKEPDGDTSKLLVYPVTGECYSDTMSGNLSWAAGVAQAGMLLKKSEFAGNSDMKSVLARMEKLPGANEDEYRKEFLYLYSRAQIN